MLRGLLSVTVLCVLLALSTRVVSGPEDASDPTAESSYIGAKACRKCHMKQHRSWKKMDHAKAWDILPEKYRDPGQKDEATDKACISCHVTGWGEGDRGGFVDAEKSAHLLGVQCEVCHGAGSKHKEAGTKVLKEKRKKFNAGEEKFINKTTTKCSSCHNPHVNHKKYVEGG